MLSKTVLREENPKDSYNSLILRSRDFISAKALMVPDALKHAMVSMVNLLVTDWSPMMEAATKRLILPHGRVVAVAAFPENNKIKGLILGSHMIGKDYKE